MIKFLPLVGAAIVAVVVIVSALFPKSELTSKVYLDQIYQTDGKVDLLATKGVWENTPVEVPQIEDIPVAVLGDSNQEKWIDIDLTSQTLIAYEGNNPIYSFRVSTGLPWTPTVTGEFYIWAKVRAQRMKGEGYDLPNVPFVQYFYKGYGIHGAYWHATWGVPISHGCVNMKIADAQVLYYWTNPILDPKQYANTKIQPAQSTRVVVHGTTPQV